MSENTIARTATDRAMLERWEDEGGRVVEVADGASRVTPFSPAVHVAPGSRQRDNGQILGFTMFGTDGPVR